MTSPPGNRSRKSAQFVEGERDEDRENAQDTERQPMQKWSKSLKRKSYLWLFSLIVSASSPELPWTADAEFHPVNTASLLGLRSVIHGLTIQSHHRAPS